MRQTQGQVGKKVVPLFKGLIVVKTFVKIAGDYFFDFPNYCIIHYGFMFRLFRLKTEGNKWSKSGASNLQS